MLHCLRDNSYRKPKAGPTPVTGERGLHPLVVETENHAPLETGNPSIESYYDEMRIYDVELSYGTKVGLHIGSCSKAALISLIKEMEATLC